MDLRIPVECVSAVDVVRALGVGAPFVPACAPAAAVIEHESADGSDESASDSGAEGTMWPPDALQHELERLGAGVDVIDVETGEAVVLVTARELR